MNNNHNKKIMQLKDKFKILIMISNILKDKHHKIIKKIYYQLQNHQI